MGHIRKSKEIRTARKNKWVSVLLLVALATALWQPSAPYALAAGAGDTAEGGDGDGDENKDATITISAAGDCTFGSDRISSSSANFYAVYNRQKDPGYFFKKVKKIFANDDMTLVNFEGTLTRRTTRADKKFAFKGSPGYANILNEGSVEAVAFANNHCRDYGSGSYTDTIQCFRKADVAYSSYAKVGVYKVKGKKIGMISVNGLEGMDYAKQLVSSGMKKLKKKRADIRIVSMHMGIEYDDTPTGEQKEIARYAVNQGAHLVLGHHPHIVQGVEKYKGAYIVYSLGNFCFGGNTNPRDKDTMIFQQKFVFRNGKLKKSRSVGKLIPCSLSSSDSINNYQPTIAGGKKKSRILRKLDKMCRPLGLTLRNGKGKMGMVLYRYK